MAARRAKAKAKAAAAESSQQAEGPLPAAAAVAEPAAEEAMPPPPARRNPIPAHALRGERSQPFGTSWVLAEVHPGGVLSAWSARCYLHGDHCNKTLNMGSTFTPEQAKHRLMEWCIRGLQFPDEPGARAAHMRSNPRLYAEDELRPLPQLIQEADG
ncbi:MAG: hypothetical protein GY772_27925 [bacterium]|nr:hypothetical protein [bacterium]